MPALHCGAPAAPSGIDSHVIATRVSTGSGLLCKTPSLHWFSRALRFSSRRASSRALAEGRCDLLVEETLRGASAFHYPKD